MLEFELLEFLVSMYTKIDMTQNLTKELKSINIDSVSNRKWYANESYTTVQYTSTPHYEYDTKSSLNI